jgi:uncharacterized membrane protein (Fun14 family)
MNLTIDLPYNAVIGSVFGITVLGIVYLITRTVIKVNANKVVCNCKKNEW